MAHQPSSQPYYDERDVSPIEGSNSQFPPPPPVHRNPVAIHTDNAYRNNHIPSPRSYNSSNNYSNYSPPGITPGVDNLGEGAAGGGINGIAIGVANMNERESGAQALRDIDGWGRNGDGLAVPRGIPQERSQGNTPFSDQYAYDHPTPPRPIQPQASYGSNAPLAAGAMAPAGMYSNNSSQHSMSLDPRSQNPSLYHDSPYNRYSSSNLNLAPQMGQINPNDVADDDDWGMGPQSTQQKRKSFVPFGASHEGSREGTPGSSIAGSTAVGTTAGAAAGAGAYAATRDASGQYNAVPSGDNQPELVREKSEWLDRQNHGKKRLTWIVSSIIAIVVLGAIIGGVLGAVLHKGGGGGSDSSKSGSAAVAADNKDDLTADSDEIKKLMNNKNLHKVFPGMDYTPLNAQYPDCLNNPPSQNNITRDMAVMSQLTNAVRLYGTDCNQTEMVLHSIDKLKLTDMKVWMGVWLGTNDTTNSRQVSQMYDVLDNHKASLKDIFKGIIIGNEVLFRKDLNETTLMKYITDVKDKLKNQYGSDDLKVATSDLGDNWTADMATQVDIVMSNVHPFFAGVEVDKAAGWTWDFWTTHDVALTKSDTSIKQIIAEVGWPSGGGNDCGESTCTSSTQGSIAGIDEMNKFMEDWICPSMKNGTEYFWFSAFDEPWKIVYNEKGKEWEDKWGLMDVDRNLKSGLTIPDCDGQTVSS